MPIGGSGNPVGGGGKLAGGKPIGDEKDPELLLLLDSWELLREDLPGGKPIGGGNDPELLNVFVGGGGESCEKNVRMEILAGNFFD